MWPIYHWWLALLSGGYFRPLCSLLLCTLAETGYPVWVYPSPLPGRSYRREYIHCRVDCSSQVGKLWPWPTAGVEPPHPVSVCSVCQPCTRCLHSSLTMWMSKPWTVDGRSAYCIVRTGRLATWGSMTLCLTVCSWYSHITSRRTLTTERCLSPIFTNHGWWSAERFTWSSVYIVFCCIAYNLLIVFLHHMPLFTETHQLQHYSLHTHRWNTGEM